MANYYCDFCSKYGTKLLKCSGCNVASYCNPTCQKSDWTRHKLTCGSSSGKRLLKGTGYGGGIGDEKQRAKGMKLAAKRETETWEQWQKELNEFCSSHSETVGTNNNNGRRKPAAASQAAVPKEGDENAILNTLKQVLRCQAPDWYWKQPQRHLYETALKMAEILTEKSPKAWGDPEDEESTIAALEELTQTSQLLAKQLSSTPKKKKGSTCSPPPSKPRGKANKKPISTNDQDDSLLLQVISVSEEAKKAVKLVLELPECSMMGPGEFYRQKLRPFAFEMVESFDQPPHYFTVNAGYQPGRYHMPYASRGRGGKKAAAASKNKNEGPGPSAHSLWKELSTYPTALPIEYGSSIFVRAQEGKMDHLRVLILGPGKHEQSALSFLFR